MPQPYNLTVFNDSTNLITFAQGANQVASGYLGIFISGLLFIVLFVSFKNFEGKRAFAAAAFLSALLSIFLRVLNLLPDLAMFAWIVLAAGSLLMLYWGD